MDQQLLIQLGMAAVGIFIVLTLFSGGGGKVQDRLSTISGEPQKDGTFAFLKKEDQGSSRRKQIEESLGKMEEAKKDRAKQLKTLKSRLVQANWSVTPQTYRIVSIGLGLFVAAGGFVLLPSGKQIYALAAGLALGYVLPHKALSIAIARRQKKFLQVFPDAMDIIVRGVRSGLPLNDCLKVIAHESSEPVAGEFKLVVQGEQVGVPLEICLERLSDRMPLAEVNFFATVLAIQRQSGGNLGEVLNNLSGVLRGRKVLREKIKALSAEAKMSAIIVGSLPIVVMVLVTLSSPDYMVELYTTSTGHRMLAISAIMMTIGTLSMRKMINFKL